MAWELALSQRAVLSSPSCATLEAAVTRGAFLTELHVCNSGLEAEASCRAAGRAALGCFALENAHSTCAAVQAVGNSLAAELVAECARRAWCALGDAAESIAVPEGAWPHGITQDTRQRPGR